MFHYIVNSNGNTSKVYSNEPWCKRKKRAKVKIFFSNDPPPRLWIITNFNENVSSKNYRENVTKIKYRRNEKKKQRDRIFQIKRLNIALWIIKEKIRKIVLIRKQNVDLADAKRSECTLEHEKCLEGRSKKRWWEKRKGEKKKKKKMKKLHAFC